VFELYQLRYFTAVVDTGGFTRASQRVRVSQPTLSAGIRKLEQAVGVSLLERSSRRVALTREGTRFLEHARRILAEAEAAMAGAQGGAPRETLQLGVLGTIPGSVMARIVTELMRSAPDLALEVVDGTERELHARLESGRLQVVLGIERSEVRSRAEALFEEGYTVAITRSHALARRSSLEVRELATEPTIVRTRCEALANVSRFFTGHGVRPAIAYRTSEDERALAMVGAGLGITVMPQSYHSDEVVQIPLQGFDQRRRIALIFSSPRERKAKVTPAARILEAARAACGSLPGGF
jgi:DNA-binding transcriptional LysR family regulator